jgi:hypothetical protein
MSQIIAVTEVVVRYHELWKNSVVRFTNGWPVEYFTKTNERVPLSALPVQTALE